MVDIVNRIEELLSQKGVSGYRMCADLDMSRSFLTELRKGRTKGLALDTANKIATYFGVSVDYLLGNVSEPFFHLDDGIPEKEKASTPKDERIASTDDLKIALFGGEGEVTDEMWEEAQFAAQLIKERHKRKTKGND